MKLANMKVRLVDKDGKVHHAKCRSRSMGHMTRRMAYATSSNFVGLSHLLNDATKVTITRIN